MEEESLFVSRIRSFLEKRFGNQEHSEGDAEGFFVIGGHEFGYRLRANETLHAYRVSVDVVREHFNSFLDEAFKYCQELFCCRVLRALANRLTWKRIAGDVVDKMKLVKRCPFCPYVFTSDRRACDVCSFSFNFDDRCSVCHERVGKMVTLPNCRHRLHSDCVHKLQQKKCPVCRKAFE